MAVKDENIYLVYQNRNAQLIHMDDLRTSPPPRDDPDREAGQTSDDDGDDSEPQELIMTAQVHQAAKSPTAADAAEPIQSTAQPARHEINIQRREFEPHFKATSDEPRR